MVVVSDSKKPIFPEACPICGAPGSDPLVPLPLLGEESRVDYFLYRGRQGVRGPGQETSSKGISAHHACIRKVQRTLLKHFLFLVLVGAAIAGMAILCGLGLTVGLIAAVLLATPLFYFEFRQPLPFEYHHHPRLHVFTFENREYADEMAGLNGTVAREVRYPFEVETILPS